MRKNSFITSAVQSWNGLTSKGMSPARPTLSEVITTLLKDGVWGRSGQAGVFQIFCEESIITIRNVLKVI